MEKQRRCEEEEGMRRCGRDRKTGGGEEEKEAGREGGRELSSPATSLT